MMRCVDMTFAAATQPCVTKVRRSSRLPKLQYCFVGGSSLSSSRHTLGASLLYSSEASMSLSVRGLIVKAALRDRRGFALRPVGETLGDDGDTEKEALSTGKPVVMCGGLGGLGVAIAAPPPLLLLSLLIVLLLLLLLLLELVLLLLLLFPPLLLALVLLLLFVLALLVKTGVLLLVLCELEFTLAAPGSTRVALRRPSSSPGYVIIDDDVVEERAAEKELPVPVSEEEEEEEELIDDISAGESTMCCCCCSCCCCCAEEVERSPLPSAGVGDGEGEGDEVDDVEKGRPRSPATPLPPLPPLEVLPVLTALTAVGEGELHRRSARLSTLPMVVLTDARGTLRVVILTGVL